MRGIWTRVSSRAGREFPVLVIVTSCCIACVVAAAAALEAAISVAIYPLPCAAAAPLDLS